MNVHFIAIGGSAMHNLALALHNKRYRVTGSDDEIFDPARGRLAKAGILPDNTGWFPEKIHSGLDAVILGMHAKGDNPELLRAKELGLKIYSYPEFLYEQAKDKLRVVIGGSHGKTTITAMILHALQAAGKDFDYMVGAQLRGFDVMVKLSHEADLMIFEGDEYLTSALDRRPKFHVYQPDIALISGIAWDHMNVFPTFENYKEQFSEFVKLIPETGTLIYCIEDEHVTDVSRFARKGVKLIPYGMPEFTIQDGRTKVFFNQKPYELSVFGNHNLLNLEGARNICEQLGISGENFYASMRSFSGASKRLETLYDAPGFTLFKDFAHSPSKVKATSEAVKQQFPDRTLVGCLELHTYSSLNPEFLKEYRSMMDAVDIPVVYFSEHALQIKKLPPLSDADVRNAFNNQKLVVFTDSGKMMDFLKSLPKENMSLLMMSSGDFDGLDLLELKN